MKYPLEQLLRKLEEENRLKDQLISNYEKMVSILDDEKKLDKERIECQEKLIIQQKKLLIGQEKLIGKYEEMLGIDSRESQEGNA